MPTSTSHHTGYAAILDGKTMYGINITKVEEHTKHNKYAILILTGTYRNHLKYDNWYTGNAPTYPVRINLYYDHNKGIEKGIIDGACAITTSQGIQECDLHDTCAKYLDVFGACTMHAAIYNIATFFHNSL